MGGFLGARLEDVCPLCRARLIEIDEHHLDIDGAMFTKIGEISPERLATVRQEARNLLAFEASSQA